MGGGGTETGNAGAQAGQTVMSDAAERRDNWAFGQARGTSSFLTRRSRLAVRASCAVLSPCRLMTLPPWRMLI